MFQRDVALTPKVHFENRIVSFIIVVEPIISLPPPFVPCHSFVMIDKSEDIMVGNGGGGASLLIQAKT